MKHHRLSIYLLVLLFILTMSTNVIAQDDSYPLITKQNASGLEQVGIIGGDQGRIAVSSDDHWLAVAGNQGVWLIDLTIPDASPVLLAGHTEKVNAVDFSNDNSLLASASDDDTIRLWSIPDGEELKVLEGHSDDVRDIDFDKLGVGLASASSGEDNTVRIWLLESGEEVRQYTDVPEGYSQVEFMNSVSYLLAGTNNSSIAAWALNDNRFVAEINEGFNSHVTGIATSPIDSKIAISLFSGRVILGDLENNSQSNLEYHDQGANDVAFSPDGKLLASVGMDNNLILVETESGEKLHEFEREDYIYSVAFGGDSSIVYAASNDGKVTAWHINSGEILREIPLAYPTVRAIAYSPDGKTIAAVTDEDYLARVFDAETLEQIAILQGHTGRTFGLSYSPDGSILATVGGNTNPILLWDTQTWEQIASIPNEERNVYSVAFSPDGSILATGAEKTIHLYDTETLEEVSALDNGETVWGLAFSPDGSILAAPAGLWDIAKAEKLPMVIGKFSAVSISPKGDLLATSEGITPLPVTSTVSAPLGYGGLNNTYTAFSPDGSLVAIAQDNDIQLVDVNLQQIVTVIKGHESGVRSVAFSPDGTKLISGSYDATIRVWAITGDASSESDTVQEVSMDGLVLDFIPQSPDPVLSESAITLESIGNLKTLVIRQTIAKPHDLAVSPDGTLGVISASDGAYIINLSDPTIDPILLQSRNSAITSSAILAEFSTSGKILAISHGFLDEGVASGSGISFWDVTVPSPTELRSVPLENEKVVSLAFNPDDSLLAMGLESNKAQFYDPEKDEIVATTQQELFGAVNGLQFDAEGSVLSLSDTAGNKALFNLDGTMVDGFNSGIAYPILFAPENAFMYSAEQDGFVLRNGTSGATIAEHAYPDSLNGDIKTSDLANGQLVAASANTIWFLDYQSGEISQTITGFDTGISSASATTDGKQLIGLTGDGILHIWDIESGEEISQRSFGYTDILASYAISADGRFVAYENKDTSIIIYDLIADEEVRELETEHTSSFHFVPGTNLLATSEFKKKLEFWDVDTGEMMESVDMNDGWVLGFSDNAEYMLTTTDNKLTLQNIHTGAVPLDDATVHLGSVLDADMLTSANLLATAGDDSTVKLWDISTGEQVGLIRAASARVEQVAFSPADSYVATLAGGIVSVWDYSDMTNITQVYNYEPISGFENELFFTADGSLLMAHLSDDLTVWSMADGTKLGSVYIPSGKSILTNDGGLIVAADIKGSIVTYFLAE